MGVSSGFVFIGLLMVLVGVIFIYLSIRATPSEINGEKDRIRYIGPLPIVVEGERKWILLALLVTTFIILYLVTKPMYLGLRGAVRIG
jgi:uncharacterized membrane protein